MKKKIQFFGKGYFIKHTSAPGRRGSWFTLCFFSSARRAFMFRQAWFHNLQPAWNELFWPFVNSLLSGRTMPCSNWTTAWRSSWIPWSKKMVRRSAGWWAKTNRRHNPRQRSPTFSPKWSSKRVKERKTSRRSSMTSSRNHSRYFADEGNQETWSDIATPAFQ